MGKQAVSKPRPRAAVIATEKPGNKQRILEGTIELMNQRGGAVGTSQIAEYLGVSPGNLYYHFRNREEILRELFERMRAELEDVLHIEAGDPIDVRRLASCYIGGAQVLWRFRFFFASAVDFIGRDPWLSQRYLDFSDRSKRYISLIIQSAVRANPGRCVPTTRECGQIAETMWVLWVSWPRYSELSRPGTTVGPADIGHGLEQIASLLSPYLAADFQRRVIRAVHRFVTGLESGGA